MQESYAMLNKHGINVVQEEVERCDSLRYKWERLKEQARGVQQHLIDIQPTFKSDLLEKVEVYQKLTSDFYGDYEEVGACVSSWQLILTFLLFARFFLRSLFLLLLFNPLSLFFLFSFTSPIHMHPLTAFSLSSSSSSLCSFLFTTLPCFPLHSSHVSTNTLSLSLCLTLSVSLQGGPNVDGIAPREASDRLQTFQVSMREKTMVTQSSNNYFNKP